MKAKKIVTAVITVIAGLLVIFSGVLKLIRSEEVVNTLSKLGVISYITWLGLMEILFAVLFLYPKTMKTGFILLSCYFSGALATELSHGSPFNALIPIILIWIAAFLRDRSVFYWWASNCKINSIINLIRHRPCLSSISEGGCLLAQPIQ